jgi:type I restriction enzyme S subunit
MSSQWKASKLSEVLTLKRGYDLPSQDRRTGQVPILGSFGVTGFHDIAKISGPGVTIGRSGASIGVATFSQVDFWPLNTALYVSDFKGNDPAWVYRLLHNIDFSSYNSGSAQPSLNRNFLSDIEVTLPPLAEQRGIAAALGALDNLIDQNRTLMDSIRELSQAILNALVTSETDLVPLTSIAHVNPERATKPSDEKVIYLAISDVSDGFVTWPIEVTWSEAPAAARLIGRAGDVIWSRVRPNRRSHALLSNKSSKLVITTGMVVLRPKVVSSAYLATVTDSEDFSTRLTQRADGTAYPTVDAEIFLQSEVPRLNQEQMSHFDKVMAPLWEVLCDLDGEIQDLIVVRNELLPLLMSGMARISKGHDK